jgi:hypothetical protein
MTRTRWTGLAGLLFGAMFFFAGFFAGTTPDTDGSNAVQKYADHFNDSSNQSHNTISAFVLTYAFVLLVCFAAGLRHRLRAVDSGPLPGLVLGLGAAAATALLIGGETSFAMGTTADQASSFKVDGNLAMLLDNLGYQILAPGIMAAAAMAVVVGILTLRTRALPVWTAWLGFLLGLCAVGSYFSAWTGFIGLPLWSVAVGVVLLLQPDPVPAGVDAPAVETVAAT